MPEMGRHVGKVFCSCGIDPPKKESGRVGGFEFLEESCRDVSAENGSLFFTARILFQSVFGIPSMYILRTRLCCLSAATMFLVSCGFDIPGSPLTTMGNAGQISSVFYTGLLFVQRSCSCRRCGEANTMHHHLLHTCTSICHASSG